MKTFTPPHGRNIRYGIGLLTLLGSIMGCFGQRGALSEQVPANLALGSADIMPHNAILAVGGTLQLSMVTTMFFGTPATQLDSMHFEMSTPADTQRVTVTRDGLMTGVSVTSASVAVNGLAFLNGTIQGDQILVQVTPAALSGLTLSIQPPAGDSAKLASGTVKTITPVLRNPTTGSSVSGAQLQYQVGAADVDRVGVFTGVIRINPRSNSGLVARYPGPSFLSPSAKVNQIAPFTATGSAWIYARVNAYGAYLQDSVLYSFSYPYTGTVVSKKTNLAVMTTLDGGSPDLSPGSTGSIPLAPGGIVTFSNNVAATDPLTIAYTFDNPGAATAPATSPSTTGGAAGNVTALIGGQSSRRQFLTPGTYHWTTVAAGGPAPWPGQTFSGTITVK